LQLRGVEDSVVPVGADGESLRVVFEGVGWRVFAFIGDAKLVGIFDENEIGVCAGVLDRAGEDVSSDAEVARINLRPHGLEFLNGDVVTPIGFDATYGQIGDGRQYDYDRDADIAALMFPLHNDGFSLGRVRRMAQMETARVILHLILYLSYENYENRVRGYF
jgi:hypothetical protein